MLTALQQRVAATVGPRRWLPHSARRTRTILPAALAVLAGVGLGGIVLLTTAIPLRFVALLLLVIVGAAGVIVVGHVRRFVLAGIVLDIPLQLDGNLFYQQDLAALGAIGGLSISLTFFGLVLLYALWLAEWLAGRRVAQPMVTRPWWPRSFWPAVYVAFVLLSLIVAQNRLLASFEVFMLLQMLLLYIYIVAHTRTRRDVLFLVALLLAGLVIESAMMVLVIIVGRDIDFFVAMADYDRGRAGGTLGSPIISAGFLYLLLAPALSILITDADRRLRALALVAFALGGLALIFTFSRGGWLAFTLSCGILIFFTWQRGWLPWQIPLVSAAIIITLGLVFQDAILARIFGDDNGSAASRWPLMELAARMIIDNPLGVGVNNFAFRLREYALVDRAGVWLYTVHNKFLLIWAETSLLSLVAYLGFLFTTLLRGWRVWRQKDRFLSPLALALAAAILGNMVHMLVDVFHSRGVVELLWFNAALITAVFAITQEERATSRRTAL